MTEICKMLEELEKGNTEICERLERLERRLVRAGDGCAWGADKWNRDPVVEISTPELEEAPADTKRKPEAHDPR